MGPPLTQRLDASDMQPTRPSEVPWGQVLAVPSGSDLSGAPLLWRPSSVPHSKCSLRSLPKERPTLKSALSSAFSGNTGSHSEGPIT